MELDTNKPVFILAQGPSIEQLDKWIDRFKKLDVYWLSFNHFEKFANFIDILYLYSTTRYEETEEHVRKFLSRKNKFAIVSCCKYTKIPMHLAEENPELSEMFSQSKARIMRCYSRVNAGSMPNIIADLYTLGFRRMCLFGYHGGNQNSDRIEDTRKMNEFGWKLFEDVFCEYDIEINNCNKISLINTFNKIDYCDVERIYERTNNRHNR